MSDKAIYTDVTYDGHAGGCLVLKNKRLVYHYDEDDPEEEHDDEEDPATTLHTNEHAHHQKINDRIVAWRAEWFKRPLDM